MTDITYHHNDGDDYVQERDHRWSGGKYASEYGSLPYRVLSIKLGDGELKNNDSNTETVTITVKDGLEVARGTAPENVSTLSYEGDVTITVDGTQTTKTLTNGSVEFDLTTDKAAGSEIEIVAESLANHPAESDSATIEVVSE